ncbi:MAG: hypothetical protein P1V36_00480 [Planctomycetota bacterium]|nr:hypothetical protein [Planctomycetota bacterium]
MVGHPEIHGKVPCAGCHKQLWLSLDENDKALVERYEEHLHDEAHKDRIAAGKAKREAERAAAAAAAAAEASSRGATMPVLLAVIVSALVAAIVSGFMSSRHDGGEAKTTKSSDNGWAQLTSVRGDLAKVEGTASAASTEASSLRKALDALTASTTTRLDALTASLADEAAHPDVGTLKELRADLVKQLEAISAAQNELGNRIEGYYVKVRQLDSRVKKLENP